MFHLCLCALFFQYLLCSRGICRKGVRSLLPRWEGCELPLLQQTKSDQNIAEATFAVLCGWGKVYVSFFIHRQAEVDSKR